MATVVENRVALTAHEAFDTMKKTSQKLRTEPYANRKRRLNSLKQWIIKNRTTLHEAVYKDMGKPATEFDGVELLMVLNEIKLALKNLDLWIRPTPVDATLDMIGTRSHILYEPKGVCLIISPWNYPFCLCITPLVSALAAGNAAVLKPSEFTPHMSDAIAKMVADVFEPDVVTVYQGGPDVSQSLLKLPLDHIFFTGSPEIGKVVMREAANHLASVTLELGGKCPAIVAESANLRDAAERIAVTKFINAGQTCVAPDYVLVDRKVASRFLEKLKKNVTQAFIEKDEAFSESRHYTKIIHERHFERLNALLLDAVDKGATVRFGGSHDKKNLFFHPVILSDVPRDSGIMQEEIFGPILPVIVFDSLQNATDIVNSFPKPLALYLFSNRRRERETVLKGTSSGGVCINDCGIHVLHNKLPFGGVNHSGIGRSHGYAGFKDFSNERAVLKQRAGFTSIKIFYPPYTAKVKLAMDWFLKLFHR